MLKSMCEKTEEAKEKASHSDKKQTTTTTTNIIP
jgi:hypothetical protein